jgi:CheY-like chemotaxis protein
MLTNVSRVDASRTVLLVEDDDDVRDIIAEILQNQGFTVTTADDGKEGLEILRSSPRLPDVLLVDLMMPVLDGPGLIEAAMTSVPDFAKVPIIVITAAGSRAAGAQVPMELVRALLHKPFDLDDLVATMNLAMASDELSRQGPKLHRSLLRYLSRRGDEIARLREALLADEFGEVEAIARRLMMTGRGFGFVALVAAGEKLAHAASMRDRPMAERGIHELADVILGLQISS